MAAPLRMPAVAVRSDLLEHAVSTIAEQAVKADELVDEAKDAGGGNHPVTVHARSKCGLDVHWVSGLGVSPGHWAHREPAPHGEPAI